MCDQRNDLGDDVDELSDSDDSEPEEPSSRAPFDPDLDRDDDDDDNDDGNVVVSAPAAQTSFSLRGGSSAFSDRSQSIFDCLDSVTKLTPSSLNQDHVTDGEFVQPRPPHPSRKTIQPPFTSPTPPKTRGIPDYLVHPERWTHYSLEDVTETSDQDNSRAAHHFLFGLQRDRECDSSCDVEQRMIFSRPNRLLKEQTADQLPAGRGKKRGMHLSHLEEEEEEEEEEQKEEKVQEVKEVGAEGRERDEARGGRTDQSEEDTEDRKRSEEKDIQKAAGQPEEEKQKRQVQKEEGEEEKTEEVNPSFTSFRKMKSKNYRKSSERDDNSS